MLDFIGRVLRRRFAVTTASNPQEALERLSSEEFELVITDHQMPKVSGLEMLAQVGNTGKRQVRIVLSGFAEAPEIQTAMDVGEIHNYILKPIDSRKLLHAVESAYQRRDDAPGRRDDASDH